MAYSVHEMYLTLQGEGAQTGQAAVFLRFAGCNLWSGREADRHRGPGGCSRWCDTWFVGTDGPHGGRFASADALADAVQSLWTAVAPGAAWVVCTGGEPLLQLDTALIEALHARDLRIAVETNGTCVAPDGIDWLTVSPKAGAVLRQPSGDELKLVYPQPEPEMNPARFADLDFRQFYLQPLDGPQAAAHTQQCIAYCLAHPQWRLSAQTHKWLQIP